MDLIISEGAIMRQHWLAVALVLIGIGCGSDKPPVPEPEGMPVELNQEDRQHGVFAPPEFQEWLTWNSKGNALQNGGYHAPYTTPTAEELQQALYCYNKAQEAWPKKAPQTMDDEDRRKHRPVSIDTLLVKGALYRRLKRPELAKYCFEQYLKYMPNSMVESALKEVNAELNTK
jgi:hypothetical protein